MALTGYNIQWTWVLAEGVDLCLVPCLIGCVKLNKESVVSFCTWGLLVSCEFCCAKEVMSFERKTGEKKKRLNRRVKGWSAWFVLCFENPLMGCALLFTSQWYSMFQQRKMFFTSKVEFYQWIRKSEVGKEIRFVKGHIVISMGVF